MRAFIKKYGAILFMCFTALIVMAFLYFSGLSLKEIPQIVKDNHLLAILVTLGLFILKGFSGVILYNALVIAVSLVFPLAEALIISAIGTAVTLSISYFIGYKTDVNIIEKRLDEHPDIKKYIDMTKSYGFIASFAIHLLGLSMEVLGIIFGFMRINFWAYLISSWLAIIPGMAAFTIAGGTLDFKSVAFWIVCIIDAVLIAFGYIYTKKKILIKHSVKEEESSE